VASHSAVHDAEQYGEKRPHRDAEDQHAKAQSDVGLNTAAEQLDAMLVHAMSIFGVGSTVLVSDRTGDDRLSEQPGEQERQYRTDQAGHQAACDQTLFHVTGDLPY
jgi:hypothetical protein